MNPQIERLLREIGASGQNEAMRGDAEVYRTEAGFLKIAPVGALQRAALMQEHFAKKGFASELLAYDSDGERDYLLVEAVTGRQGLDLLDDPKALTDRFAAAVRALHESGASDCPVNDVNECAVREYLRRRGKPYEGDVSLLKKDAPLHGDCCLPNIFFTENGARFIDLGEGGVGDRHFDLYWARWSLAYNLKTEEWGERFLDAYGRDAVDPRRLTICAALSRFAD